MTQPPFPPPPSAPPPPRVPGSFAPGEFHLPRTNLFRSFRVQLAALEQLPRFKSDMEPILGLSVGLVLGSLVGVIIPLGMNTAIFPALGEAQWAGSVIVAPITEEFAKTFCILIVAFSIPNMFPNRRYGAAVGASVGLGFDIFETMIYMVTGRAPGIDGLVRLMTVPAGHPLFAAFEGIGVFVFMARKPKSKDLFEAVFGLPLFMLLFAMVDHAAWNAFASLLPRAGGIWATPYLETVLAMLTIFPLFVFLLRDLLGGHFNFQHFFEPLSEPSPFYPTIAPPPPPPPTFPTCQTCGQPLAFIPEYNRWYCAKEKKYV